jgi:DNA polymerase-3 subunit delta'
MPFSDIIGHEKQLASLRWALEEDRLHHAYLFLGPEGVGKRTLALSLAKAIQCLERPHDFCGECANCVRTQNGNHPDVHGVAPLAEKREITIQQVRELEKDLSFRAFSGRKKIAIVDPAHLMNFYAQNALLKTLEEPPRDSLLILISTSVGGLLPTVLSRCLRLSFAHLPSEDVVDFLVSRKAMKREQAVLLAAMTMGSLGKALSSDMEDLVQKRKAWVEEIVALSQRDCKGWMALAERLAGDREESLKFLDWVGGWFRDILIYRVAGTGQVFSNIDMTRNITEQANTYSLEKIFFLLSEVSRTSARIRRNVNRRMALENFLMKVSSPGSEFHGRLNSETVNS